MSSLRPRRSRRRASLAGLVLGLAVPAAPAELTFGTLNSYDPVGDYSFGHPEDVPAGGITYVRSSVDSRHTDVTLVLEHPDFRLVGHSCPSTLARGKSCMVFVAFEPRSQPPADPCDSEVRGRLVVRSAEGDASLRLSGHRPGTACVARGGGTR